MHRPRQVSATLHTLNNYPLLNIHSVNHRFLESIRKELVSASHSTGSSLSDRENRINNNWTSSNGNFAPNPSKKWTDDLGIGRPISPMQVETFEI